MAIELFLHAWNSLHQDGFSSLMITENHGHAGEVPVNRTRQGAFVYRHSILVRATHWIGVVCVTILLLSGLQIFNAHPALYLGTASDFVHPIASIGTAQRGDRQAGVTTVLGHSLVTTGLLGVSGRNEKVERAFPAWATLPGDQDLATGRRWHFFFAWLLVLNGLTYLIFGLASGHVWHDLIPPARQLRGVGGSILDHLRLRFPRGEEARHYNVLQRLSYLAIIFLIVPLLILTGLTMSPGIDAALPLLAAYLGGRQTARTIHFCCAFLLLGFALVHVAMVLLSGLWNNLRSMITGWYRIRPERALHVRED